MNQKIKHSLNTLYFYLTEGCNLTCRHCWLAPQHHIGEHTFPVLDIEIFRSVIRQGKSMGVSGVKLTGGEPLLHPRIDEILDMVQKEDLSLFMETNGVLCTRELASKIAGCRLPFAAVSLDGSDAQTHEWVRGVKGSFQGAIRGIQNLVKAGLKPQIIMTVMRRNREQLKDIVRLAEILGAGSIKFNILQPAARGEQMHVAGEALTIDELVELGRWVEAELASSTDISLHFSHPPAFSPLGRIFQGDGDNCDTCGILGIMGVLPDGSYALCGIGETIPDLIFGNASEDMLENVWNESPKIREIREGIPSRFKGICRECLMLRRCFGKCVAMNYYSNRDFWAPYWYCDQAFKKGLFPKSRMRQ